MKEMNDSMKNAEQLRKEAELLREKKEELFFEMMFAAFDETDAPKYAALNEQLKNDPTCQVSEEEDKAMLEFIAREIKKRDEALAKRNRDNDESAKAAKKKPVRRTRSSIIKVVVIAAILMLMGVTSYATIPSFRAMTQNLLIEASKVATRVAITDSENRADRTELLEGTDIVLLGYKFPGVPEGFMQEDAWDGDNRAWVRYVDTFGKTIKFQVYHGAERDTAMDTEDAHAEKIEIHGCEGLMSTKDAVTTVSWYDEESKTYIAVITKEIDEETTFNLACDTEKIE